MLIGCKPPLPHAGGGFFLLSSDQFFAGCATPCHGQSQWGEYLVGSFSALTCCGASAVAIGSGISGFKHTWVLVQSTLLHEARCRITQGWTSHRDCLSSESEGEGGNVYVWEESSCMHVRDTLPCIDGFVSVSIGHSL